MNFHVKCHGCGRVVSTSFETLAGIRGDPTRDPPLYTVDLDLGCSPGCILGVKQTWVLTARQWLFTPPMLRDEARA